MVSTKVYLAQLLDESLEARGTKVRSKEAGITKSRF